MSAKTGLEQKLGQALPLDVVLKDEKGAAFPVASVFGQKPVILNFVYYECPMLCNEVLNGLLKALRAMNLTAGKDFDILTVSIDPTETPALAQKKKDSYLSRYRRPEAAAGWHFLTGDEAAVRRLADAAGFRYTQVPDTEEYAHAAGIMVATPEGRLSRYFYGIEYSAKDLRLGLVEASGNKIGSLVDQLLLLCYHYNPATGKYGFAVTTALRVGGLATLGALGGFVFLSLKQERRAHT